MEQPSQEDTDVSWPDPLPLFPTDSRGCVTGNYGDRLYVPGGRLIVTASGYTSLTAELQAGVRSRQNRSSRGQFSRGRTAGSGGISTLMPNAVIVLHFLDVENPRNRISQNFRTDGVPRIFDRLDDDTGYDVQVGADMILPLPGENAASTVSLWLAQ